MDRPVYFPTRAHVLACTGPKCSERGARQLFATAWSAAETRGLAYYARGGSVRLTESGCQGACEHGPNVIAYYAHPEGGLVEAWYHGVDEARLLALLEALHHARPLPEEGRYDR